MLGPILASVHNLRLFARLLERARAAIEGGRYASFASAFLSRYGRENDVPNG
jgi:tRNA-guanine family transglycosylase